MKKISVDELLAKARKPAEDAMKLHPFYRGKVQIFPKCAIRDMNDFAICTLLEWLSHAEI